MTFTPTLVVSLAAGTTVARANYGFGRSPFCAGSKCIVSSPGAATPMGLNHPGSLATTKYAQFVSTGAASYARATFTPLIAAYDVTVAASLDQTKYLLLIVIVNGVMLHRFGSDGAPGTNEFQATNANTLAFGGTAPAAGALIEVLAMSASDLQTITGGALVAGKQYVINMFDFVSCGVAAITNFTAVAPGV